MHETPPELNIPRALEDDSAGQLLILETSSRLLASHCQAPAAPTGCKSNKQVVAN